MKGEGTRVFTKRGKLKKETKPKKEKKKPKGVGPRTIIKKEVIEIPKNEVIEVPKPRGRPRKEPAFVPFVFNPPPSPRAKIIVEPDLFRGEPEAQKYTQRKPGDPFKERQFEFLKDRTARLGKSLGDKFRDAIADFKALPKAEKKAKLKKMATFKTSYITPEEVDKAKTVSSLEALYLQNLVGVQQYQEGQQLGVPIQTLEGTELGVDQPPPKPKKTRRSKSAERAEPKPKPPVNPLDLADQPKKRGRPKKEPFKPQILSLEEAEKRGIKPPKGAKSKPGISVSSEPLAPLILPQLLQPEIYGTPEEKPKSKKLTPKLLKTPPTSPERKEELKKERSPKKPLAKPIPKMLKSKVTPVEAEKEKLLEELKAEVSPKLKPKVSRIQELDSEDEDEHDAETAALFAKLPKQRPSAQVVETKITPTKEERKKAMEERKAAAAAKKEKAAKAKELSDEEEEQDEEDAALFAKLFSKKPAAETIEPKRPAAETIEPKITLTKEERKAAADARIAEAARKKKEQEGVERRKAKFLADRAKAEAARAEAAAKYAEEQAGIERRKAKFLADRAKHIEKQETKSMGEEDTLSTSIRNKEKAKIEAELKQIQEAEKRAEEKKARAEARAAADLKKIQEAEAEAKAKEERLAEIARKKAEAAAKEEQAKADKEADEKRAKEAKAKINAKREYKAYKDLQEITEDAKREYVAKLKKEKADADKALKEAKSKEGAAERGKALAAAKAKREEKARLKKEEEDARKAADAEAYRQLEERRQLITKGAATTITSKLKAINEGQKTRAKLAKTQEERESAFGDLQLKALQAKAKEAGKEATKEKLKQSIEERQAEVRQSRETRQSKEPTLKLEPRIKAKANVAEAQRKAQEDRKKWEEKIKEKHEKAQQAKEAEKAEREKLKGVRSKAATEARQRAKDIKLAAAEEERQMEEAAIEAERLRRIELDLLVSAEELRQAEEKRVANEVLEARLKAEEQEGEESEKEGAKKTVAPRGRKVTKEETEARARRKKSLEDKKKQAQARYEAAQEAERLENEKLRAEIEERIAKREKSQYPLTEKDKEKMRNPDYLDFYKKQKEKRRKEDEEYEARLKEEEAMKKAQANQAEIKSLVKARKPATEPSEEELAAKERYEAEQKSAEKLAKAKLAEEQKRQQKIDKLTAQFIKEGETNESIAEDLKKVISELEKNIQSEKEKLKRDKTEEKRTRREATIQRLTENLERQERRLEDFTFEKGIESAAARRSKEIDKKEEKKAAKKADEKRKEAIAETEEETRQRQFRLATGSVDELYESDFKPYFEALGINSLEEFKQLKRPLRDEILSLTRQEIRGRVGKRDVDRLERLEQKVAKSKAKKAPKEKSEEEQAQEKQEAIKRLAEVRRKKQPQQTLLQRALEMEREAEERAEQRLGEKKAGKYGDRQVERAKAKAAKAQETEGAAAAEPTVSKSSIREKLLKIANIPRSSYAADSEFKKEIDQEVNRIASLSGELSKHQIEFNKERAAQLGDKYRALKDLEETGSVVSIGAESTESARAPKQKGARHVTQELSRLNAVNEARDFIPGEPLGPESPQGRGEGLPYGRAKGMGDLSDGDYSSDSDQEEKLSHYTYIMPSSPILRRGFRHPAMASPGMSDHLHPNAAANIHAFSGGLLRTQPTDTRYRQPINLSRSRSPSPDDMRGMGMSGCGKSLKEKMEKVYHKAVPKSLRPAVEDLGEAAVDYAVNSKKVKAKRQDVRDDYNKAVPQSLKEPIKDLAVASGKYAKRQSGFGLKKGSEEARKFMAALRARKGKKMKGGKIPAPPSRSPITDPSLL